MNELVRWLGLGAMGGLLSSSIACSYGCKCPPPDYHESGTYHVFDQTEFVDHNGDGMATITERTIFPPLIGATLRVDVERKQMVLTYGDAASPVTVTFAPSDKPGLGGAPE